MAQEFDLENEIENYPCSNMIKSGFKFYLEQRKIKVNSKKDFEKNLQSYLKTNIGG